MMDEDSDIVFQLDAPTPDYFVIEQRLFDTDLWRPIGGNKSKWYDVDEAIERARFYYNHSEVGASVRVRKITVTDKDETSDKTWAMKMADNYLSRNRGLS